MLAARVVLVLERAASLRERTVQRLQESTLVLVPESELPWEPELEPWLQGAEV